MDRQILKGSMFFHLFTKVDEQTDKYLRALSFSFVHKSGWVYTVFEDKKDIQSKKCVQYSLEIIT